MVWTHIWVFEMWLCSRQNLDKLTNMSVPATRIELFFFRRFRISEGNKHLSSCFHFRSNERWQWGVGRGDRPGEYIHISCSCHKGTVPRDLAKSASLLYDGIQGLLDFSTARKREANLNLLGRWKTKGPCHNHLCLLQTLSGRNGFSSPDLCFISLCLTRSWKYFHKNFFYNSKIQIIVYLKNS